MEISRTFDLQAAHFLPATPAAHKCHAMHGHTWSVRIGVTGPIDPVLGWIVDYAEIDAAWTERVHARLDHTVLNDTIPNPTTELLAGWIYAAMQSKLARLGVRVSRVEIQEGNRNRCILLIDAAHDPREHEVVP